METNYISHTIDILHRTIERVITNKLIGNLDLKEVY